MQAAPDTFFLQRAAELVEANILARLDPALGAQPYFKLDYGSTPPEARHASWDYCDMAGRFVDALILTRQMTGSRDGLALERQLRAFLLARANPRDGLMYDAEAPWSRYAADMFCQGRALLGLTSWWLQTRDRAVEATLERLVAGLSRVAEHHADYCRYPRDVWIEDRWVEGGLWGGRAPGYSVQQVGGLARYAAASGSRAAIELAGKLARWFVYHSGAVERDGSYRGHTHSGGILPSAAGILRYALLAGDTGLLAWSRRVYEFTRGHCSSFGWLPDGLGLDPAANAFAGTCETCALVDLLELALLLSESGNGDYWDDVERFTRNQFLENQIRDVDRVVDAAARELSTTPVAAVLRGSFESTARPNSLLGGPEPGIEGCCTGAAGRGCFLVWSRAIVERGDGVAVNLRFSRDSPWAEVVSLEPYRGELWLTVRQARRFFVRLPDWVARDEVCVTLDGAERGAHRYGSFVVLDETAPGQRWTISYPQRRLERAEQIAGQRYTLRWRGNTVTGIEPAGTRYSIFERAAFETNEAPTAERIYEAQHAAVNW